jgi:hypothetical protein
MHYFLIYFGSVINEDEVHESEQRIWRNTVVAYLKDYRSILMEALKKENLPMITDFAALVQIEDLPNIKQI